MRLKTVLLAAAGLILLLSVGAILAVRTIDFNKYRGLIATQVKAATGRELKIGGNLSLALGLSPAVILENVSFANAGWGSRPEMVRVRRLEVQVALLPLIFRDIQVKRLVLVQPDILLETDARGAGNWSLGGTATSPAPKAGRDAARLPTLAVEKVRIEKGILTYRDGGTKQATSLVLDRLDLRARDASSPLAIDLAAAYKGKAFTVTGTLGPLRNLLAASGPYPVKLALKVGSATVEADGTVAKPLEAAGLDLKVTASGAELAEVIGLAGKRIPPLGPFTLRAQVAGSPEFLSVAGIEASAGKLERILFKAKGSVKDARSAKGVSLALTVESKDPRSAAKAFGASVPVLPPLRAATRVADAGGGYAFDDLNVTMGASSLAGSGTVTFAGPRPKVKAQFASALLDLSELFPRAEKARTGPSPQNGAGSAQDRRVFTADPFPLDALKEMDGELQLRADRLVLPNRMALEALAAHAALASGRLHIDPLGARIGGGGMTGSIGLDASASGSASLAANVEIKAMDLGQLLGQMGNPDLVRGTKTDLAMNLRGSGTSIRELMAGLDGEVLLVLGEGKINAGFLDWLGADLLTQIAEKLNPFHKGDPYTELKCGVIRFEAKGGLASTDRGIAFETSKMTLVSSGTVNLKTEAIDFSLRPDSRQVIGVGAGELVKLLRVGGTLAEPRFGLDGVETARRAVSIGAAVATAGLSFVAESLARRALADSQPCQTARGKTASPARTGVAASGTAGEAAQKSGNAVQQFFRGLLGQ